MTITLDALSLIGLACIALMFVVLGAAIASYQRHQDYRKAWREGQAAGRDEARKWFTEKIGSGEVSFTGQLAKKG